MKAAGLSGRNTEMAGSWKGKKYVSGKKFFVLEEEITEEIFHSIVENFKKTIVCAEVHAVCEEIVDGRECGKEISQEYGCCYTCSLRKYAKLHGVSATKRMFS